MQVCAHCYAQSALLTTGLLHTWLHAVLLHGLQSAPFVDPNALFQSHEMRSLVLQGWRPGLRRRQVQGGSSFWTGTCTSAMARSRSSQMTPVSSTCPSTAMMGVRSCNAILNISLLVSAQEEGLISVTWL